MDVLILLVKKKHIDKCNNNDDTNIQILKVISNSINNDNSIHYDNNDDGASTYYLTICNNDNDRNVHSTDIYSDNTNDNDGVTALLLLSKCSTEKRSDENSTNGKDNCNSTVHDNNDDSVSDCILLLSQYNKEERIPNHDIKRNNNVSVLIQLLLLDHTNNGKYIRKENDFNNCNVPILYCDCSPFHDTGIIDTSLSILLSKLLNRNNDVRDFTLIPLSHHTYTRTVHVNSNNTNIDCETNNDSARFKFLHSLSGLIIKRQEEEEDGRNFIYVSPTYQDWVIVILVLSYLSNSSKPEAESVTAQVSNLDILINTNTFHSLY